MSKTVTELLREIEGNTKLELTVNGDKDFVIVFDMTSVDISKEKFNTQNLLGIKSDN
jgi:hypothetical protein